MRPPIAVVLAVAVAAAAGCSAGGTEPYDDGADCNHLSTRGDPGLGAGFGYSEQPRALGAPVPVTVCLGNVDGTVRLLVDGSGVDVTPAVGWAQDGDWSEWHQHTFQVTVSPGATGRLRVEVSHAGVVGLGYTGPAVEVDEAAGTWQLTRWGDRDTG